MKSFIILLAGILAGILILMIYKGCGDVPPAPVIVAPKTIIKEVEKNEGIYKKKIDSLQLISQHLAKKADDLKARYNDEKERTRVMEMVINDLQLPEDHQEVINDYVDLQHQKDSTHEELQVAMEDKAAVKDQVISAKDSLYSKLRSSFDSLANNQQTLLQYNGDLKSALKKKGVGNIFWKSTAIAAALFIAKSIIQ